MFSMYNANGSKLKLGSNGYKMLQYIVANGGATKYDLVTKVLKKVGTRQRLRGYYSCYMRGWMDNGIVSYNRFSNTYEATPKGAWLLAQIPFRA